MSQYPQYNVNNEHQLIRRQNTYVLDRKLVTIHSEDRDTSKWPNSNHFEVELPSTLSNVQSMRLVEIQLPANQYVFSNNQQNTKIQFQLLPNVSTQSIIYIALANNINNPYTLTIQEGFYSPDEMANELQNGMNNAVTDFLMTDPSAASIGATYSNFKVRYDRVGQQMFFGNTYDNFKLQFNVKIEYDVPCSAIIGDNQSANVWEQNTNWGLPAYLGFQKSEYTTTETSGNVLFNYDASNIWLTPDPTYTPPGFDTFCYYVAGPKTISMFGDSAIYMEFDKFNTMDELKPYVERTNQTYNNDYNGRINSAFAKIPVTPGGQNSQIFDSRNGFLQNVSQYHPAIDKIKKAKFKFRYHDGRLVDFKDTNFNFTIAFNQLKDEIARDYVIRVPEEYRL
jgi:plasmid maintenance system killer protein|tara:strand:+ start:2988 stop:4172 length:1185 start_codon:yes stop_codon:yes gene_type:complete